MLAHARPQLDQRVVHRTLCICWRVRLRLCGACLRCAGCRQLALRRQRAVVVVVRHFRTRLAPRQWSRPFQDENPAPASIRSSSKYNKSNGQSNELIVCQTIVHAGPHTDSTYENSNNLSPCNKLFTPAAVALHVALTVVAAVSCDDVDALCVEFHSTRAARTAAHTRTYTIHTH